MTVRFRDTADGLTIVGFPKRGRLTLEEVLEVFQSQAYQLGRLDNAMRRAFLRTYTQAARDILGRTSLVGAGRGFSTQHYDVVLGQLRDGITSLYQALGGVLTVRGREAIELAQRHLAERVATLSGRFEGTVRPFSIQPVEQVLHQGSLWERFARRRGGVSRALAERLGARLQSELAVSFSTQEPFERALTRVRKVLRQGRYQAEMTARTEFSNAYNAGHHERLVQANAEGDDYQKSVIVFHDRRTHDDSRGLETWLAERGGGIPLDQNFIDGEGRSYPHPPGRPNDREVEIPWRKEWRSAAGYLDISKGARALPASKKAA